MSNFFSSSIGKKVIMSVTGLFLIMFLCVHLTMNLLLLFGDGTLFNEGAHFMATNPLIKVMEPVLAAGFIFHIIYASVLTMQNQKARPVKYEVVDQSESSTWASRNMYILGGLLLTFMVIHMANFFVKMKFGEIPTVLNADGKAIEDAYTLVSSLFINYWYYDVLYVIGAVLLALHLTHGFQSAFQTVGANNHIWNKRWKTVGNVFAVVLGFGFAIIPLFFLFVKK
jgi:succinate dehydrogenase / fumarate reductase, cytochrome b subunit